MRRPDFKPGEIVTLNGFNHIGITSFIKMFIGNKFKVIRKTKAGLYEIETIDLAGFRFIEAKSGLDRD